MYIPVKMVVRGCSRYKTFPVLIFFIFFKKISSSAQDVSSENCVICGFNSRFRWCVKLHESSHGGKFIVSMVTTGASQWKQSKYFLKQI